MSDTSHLAEDRDGVEVERAFEIALLGVSLHESSLFRVDPEKGVVRSWLAWLDDWFAPVIAPAFARGYLLADQFQVREIEEADRDLDQVLPPDLQKGSLAAAESFLEGKSQMRHHPEWERFVKRIAEGKTPGHVLTLAALQSVLYHLPLASALLAYARFEFRSGIRTLRTGEIPDEESLFLEVLPHVQVAVQSKIDNISGAEDGEGSSRLRSI